jgi:hypothetical protein
MPLRNSNSAGPMPLNMALPRWWPGASVSRWGTRILGKT